MKPITTAALVLLALTGWASGQDPGSTEYFEKYIRPVLVTKCLECHSAEHEVSGGLALDSKPAWEQGGDSGPAIEPGQPDKSRMIEAMEYGNPNLQMPPEGKLSAEVIERFKLWIAAGASDPRTESTTAKKQSTALPLERATEHWAYRPIQRPTVPLPPALLPTGTASACATPIDSFLQRKQREAGLEAASPADDAVLIRRLFFDLHGLPPAPEEIQRFLEDSNLNKYERLVERLLASPRFGERMARHWMDVARYAESITLRGFVLPQAWRYRDYLISSFNADRSFAEMIQEQVAGDLLDHPDLERRQQQQVATAFLALGNTNLEEQDKTLLEMDHIDEQLEVIGKAFMGQTLGCARCHDHKFDPIPTSDYYALAGIFRSTKAMEHDNVSKWIERPLPLPPQEQTRFDQLTAELEAAKNEQAKLEKLASSHSKPAKAGVVALGTLPGIVVDDEHAQKVGAWTQSNFEKPHVGQGYLHDAHEAGVAKTVTFEPKSLPPGNYTVRLAYTASANRSSKTIVRVFSADGERPLTINQRQKPPIEGLWITLGEYRFEKDGQAFVLVSNEEADGHVIADAVQFLPIAPSPTPPSPAPLSQTGTAATADSSDQGQPAAAQAIQAQLKQLKERRARLESELASRPMAISILEQSPPRDIPIHIRGNVHNLGRTVPRGFLQLARLETAAQPPADSSGRLQLAEWLTDPRHPLTARVISNRVWTWILGVGLVRTADNFGTTGEPPHDADLLDYLASELVDHQWSIKHLVRELVLSETYRSHHVPSERAREIDPDNRYFSYAGLKRIDVESLRDAMLTISGELHIPPPGSTLRPNVKEDYRYTHEANLRAVYLPLLRNSLPELFEAFDFPNASVSSGVRSQSTVAPQALALLNSPWVLDRARRAGQRMLIDLQLAGLIDSQQWEQVITHCFLRCVGRPPTELELYTARVLVDELQQQAATSDEIATRLIHGLFASVDFRYLD